MNEPTILPVRPGTLTDADKDDLRAAGIVVIEHENPSEVRLLRPVAELDSSDLLRCAMKALMVTSGVSGHDNRAQFTREVAAVLAAKPASPQTQGGTA